MLVVIGFGFLFFELVSLNDFQELPKKIPAPIAKGGIRYLMEESDIFICLGILSFFVNSGLKSSCL